VESIKRETAVISAGPKAIEPTDFGSKDSITSPFATKSSGWLKIYLIATTIIGLIAIGALVFILFMN